MPMIDFTQTEAEILRHLADLYLDTTEVVDLSAIESTFSKHDQSEVEKSLTRLRQFKLIIPETRASVRISSQVLDVVEQLENQPATDYVELWTRKARQNRWVAGVFIGVAVLSAAGGLLSIVKTAIELFE